MTVVTPAWMARIPDNILRAGGKRLLNFLQSKGLPRPSLLHLDAERRLRGLYDDNKKKGRR